MSDIPKTESGKVAFIAVAWEIAKLTHPQGQAIGTAPTTSEAAVKDLTNAFLKAYEAIFARKPIED